MAINDDLQSRIRPSEDGNGVVVTCSVTDVARWFPREWAAYVEGREAKIPKGLAEAA